MAKIKDNLLLVPAREIPAPSTISEAAQATLKVQSPLAKLLFSDPEPQPDDHEVWHRFISERERIGTSLLSAMPDRYPNTLKIHTLSNMNLYELTPESRLAESSDYAALYFHGGGYTSGRDINAAHLAMPFADKLRMVTFSPDYRMPPEHPFPAAVDDAVETYKFLLKDLAPDRIIIAGRSAGGGLAAACLLKARDMGLPMPAASVLQTPESDLTESGDSFRFNNGVDNLARPIPNANALYANGQDLRDPYISPLFGNYEPGFPPTILTSGTRDLFLSNTVLMHRALRRAGVEADLHVWEAMGHGGFFETAPEDEEVWEELRRFIRRHVDTFSG
jgi:acetyl esterase/lipase